MCRDGRGGRLVVMEPMTDATARPALDKEPAPVDPPLGGTEQPAVTPASTGTPTRGTGFRMHRSRTDRMLGGVCGGLAESLGVDAALLRIGLIALTLLGAGIGVVLYVAAWILVPEADAA
jgi:phage shock protein C